MQKKAVAEKTPSKKAPPKKGLSISHIALLFALLACSAAVWLWYQQEQGTVLQQGRQQQLQHAQALQQDTLETITSNLSTLNVHQSKQQALLSTYARSLQKIMAHQQSDMLDMHLEEVAYLIRLANLQLRWTRDVIGAQVLLSLADKRLAAIADPTLMPIRQRIADDIADLQAIEVPDKKGILAQLLAMQSQVEKLPAIGKEHKMPESAKVELESLSENDLPPWRRALNQSLVVIKKLVIVREHEVPVAPLLSAVSHQHVVNRTQLLLQQAQWGLVQGNALIYLNSLDSLSHVIKSHFDPNARTTKQLLQATENLQQIDVAPTLPDLSRTEKIINESLKAHREQLLGKAES